MPKLSLAMIVRDEEESLGRVLSDAAGFCDELVVVDTGSTDATVEIASRAGARVEHFEWIDDFAAARNFSFDAARGDWIIWLDADDRVTPEVQARYRAAKETTMTDDLDAILVPYHRHFSPVTGECIRSFDRERVLRKAAGLKWEGAVHEAIGYPAGRYVRREDLFIEHRPPPDVVEMKTARNMRILEKAYHGGDRSPRTLFYLGNEYRDAERHAEALDVYAQYLEVSKLTWEKHSALLSMAACARALGDEDRATAYSAQAVVTDPARAEGYMSLAQADWDRQRWERAIPLYAAATMARRPADGFLYDPDYSWRPWDYLSVCLSNAGRHDEGIEAALKSLQLGNPDAERLRANIAWSLTKL